MLRFTCLIITFTFYLVGANALSIAQSPDWLLAPESYTAEVKVTEQGKSLELTNGLLRRSFQLTPNAATRTCKGVDEISIEGKAGSKRKFLCCLVGIRNVVVDQFLKVFFRVRTFRIGSFQPCAVAKVDGFVHSNTISKVSPIAIP